jgi:hypothetical protein
MCVSDSFFKCSQQCLIVSQMLFKAEDCIPFPRVIHAGEQLAEDLIYLEKQHCTTTVHLSAAKTDDIVMGQIREAVYTMLVQGQIEFPPWTPEHLTIDATQQNHDLRLQFHELPFRVLKPGNKRQNGLGQYLSVDHSLAFHDFSHSIITKLAAKIKNPFDRSTGILVICMCCFCLLTDV